MNKREPILSHHWGLLSVFTKKMVNSVSLLGDCDKKLVVGVVIFGVKMGLSIFGPIFFKN